MRKQLIKIIKKATPQPRTVSTEPQYRRSKQMVESGPLLVAEFQQNARSETLPAFDRLFQTTSQRLS
jgi:hypothetical protein